MIDQDGLRNKRVEIRVCSGKKTIQNKVMHVVHDD